MEEFRTCAECGQPFLVIDDTDAICDNCSNKLLTGIHYVRGNYKNIWEDKEIKKQWQKASKETLEYFSENYAVQPEIKTIRYADIDPLLNKRIVIK